MARILVLSLALVALCLAGPAFAAPGDKPGDKPVKAAKAAKAATRTQPVPGPSSIGSRPAPASADGSSQTFDFEGDVIESEFLRPNSALVETVKKRAGLSLVRIKTSFLDKILATVDEL